MRRAPLTLVFALVGTSLLLIGVALLTGSTLPPLPTADSTVSRGATTTAAEQADLERAGYSFEDKSPVPNEGGRAHRTYVFQGSGTSVTLRDDEYPKGVSIPRELAMSIRFSVAQGRSPGDLPEITPGLVAAAEKSVREDPAVLAGFAYLARVSGSGVEPAALRSAVADYVQGYRQPSSSVQEPCAGCGAKDGYSDEYAGGRDMHTPLRHGWPGWEIAGLRQYLNGESAFTVVITVSVPRT